MDITDIITGIKADDLNITTQEYNTLKTRILNSTLEWTNTYLRQEYTPETLPDGLKEIILTITTEILNTYVFQMDTPVIDTENFKITTYIKQVITEDIKLRLDPYKTKTPIRVWSLTPKPVIIEEDVVD